jgi:hypothetical protein
MDRQNLKVLNGSFRFLVLGACALFALASPVRFVKPVTAAPATQLADGIWNVQGREIPGRRQCGDWLVRLTNRQGQLSGVLSLARGSVPIQNLTLQSDGSFSGNTRAGVIGTTHARAYKITGKFSGEAVNLTLQDNRCPLRHGTAVRQAGGG